MIKLKDLKPEKLLVDGKFIGDVKGFNMTYSDDENNRKITIIYIVDNDERALTCSLEAVSFGI